MAEAEVIILGRTKAGRMLCIGGSRTDDWTTLRLKRNRLPPYWPPTTCPFQIGEIYNIRFMSGLEEANPHHRENALVIFFEKVAKLERTQVRELILRNIQVRVGSRPTAAFQYSGGRQPFKLSMLGGYYLPMKNLSCLENSIGFWQCPECLEYCEGRYVNLRTDST